MDLSKANPELFAALHAAQQCAKSVPKSGKNEGRPYATAEDMLAGAKAAMADHGLAVMITTSAIDHADAPEQGAKQYVCGTLTIEWVLTHMSGGYIAGSTMIDAIANGRTPPDKASRAAETYALGFVVRGLFALNRGDMAAEGDVDARRDHDDVPTSPRGKSPPQQARPPQEAPTDPAWLAAKQAFDAAWVEYRNEHMLATDRQPSFTEITGEIARQFGMNQLPKYPSTELFERMTNYVRKATDGLASATRDPSSGPPPDDEAKPKNGTGARRRGVR